jgi:hypothetical protein
MTNTNALNVWYGGTKVVNAAQLLPSNWTATWTTITVEFTNDEIAYYTSNDPATLTNVGGIAAISTAGATYSLYASYSGSTSSRGWIRDIELIGRVCHFIFKFSLPRCN